MSWIKWIKINPINKIIELQTHSNINELNESRFYRLILTTLNVCKLNSKTFMGIACPKCKAIWGTSRNWTNYGPSIFIQYHSSLTKMHICLIDRSFFFCIIIKYGSVWILRVIIIYDQYRYYGIWSIKEWEEIIYYLCLY